MRGVTIRGLVDCWVLNLVLVLMRVWTKWRGGSVESESGGQPPRNWNCLSTSRSSGVTTQTFYMFPLGEVPAAGECVDCAGGLVRLVYEFTQNPAEAPQSLLTPVVCRDCGVRYE